MDVFAFKCWRCLDGFELFEPERRRWRPGQPASPPTNALTSSDRLGLGIRSKGSRFEAYEPLKIGSGGLFRTLADMPATPNAMLSFTNRFGLLTTSGALPTPASGTPTFQSTGVDDLLRERAALRHAVELFESGHRRELVALFNRMDWGSAKYELRLGPEDKILRVIVPTSLIHALWQQFAAHLESAATLLRCERCGDWFRVGTATGQRGTRKYCSRACKQAAYEARKET